MKIAILTSGGDAPGMNAAVRAATRAALHFGHEVYGIYYGYKGLMEGHIEKFNRFSVSEVLSRGGTFLKSARFPEFKDRNVRKEAISILKNIGIEHLIVIGGDGSFTGAKLLNEEGIHTTGIPGTIDNDLAYTDYTIGFDTAVNTAVEAIDKLRDTSGSHQRCNIVEVMGRHCGDIAIHASVATGAKYLITHETGFDKNDLFKELKNHSEIGIKYSIVVMTENITNPFDLAKEVEEEVGIESRATMLGHIQRGGTPSGFDRLLGIRMGEFAVQLIQKGVFGHCVGIDGNDMISLPFEEALKIKKRDQSALLQTFEITK